MLVAVESFDQPKSKNPEEPQLVLIQAPVVLDVTIAETIDSTPKEPDRLAPVQKDRPKSPWDTEAIQRRNWMKTG